MCDPVLGPPDVFLHRQETRHFTCRRLRGIFSTSCPLPYIGAVPSDVSSHGSEPPPGMWPCVGWPPRSPLWRSVSPVSHLKKRSRTTGVSLPTCWVSATSSSTPSSPGPSSSPLLASRRPSLRSPDLGILRRSPSTGAPHRRWNPLWLLPSPPTPLNYVSSDPLPKCIGLCAGAFHSGPSTSPACHTWGHRGWGRVPSSRITTVSLTCRCQKCNHIAVFVNARPLHPLTGQELGSTLVRNAIL